MSSTWLVTLIGEGLLEVRVVFVGSPHADAQSGVGLEVKFLSRAQGAVGVDLEEVVVLRTVAVHESECVIRVGIGISGVELAHDGSDGLVLRHGGVR